MQVKFVGWPLIAGAMAMFFFSHWVFGTHFYYSEPTKQLWGAGFLALATLLFLGAKEWGLPDRRALLLAVPFFLTIPGLVASEGRWAYHIHAEAANTLIALLWLWLFLAVQRDKTALWLGAVLLAGLAITVSDSLFEWVRLGMSAPPATNFGNQNYAANFLVLCAPLLLAAAWLRIGHRLWVWLLAFALAFLVLALVLKTRAALAGFLVALYLAVCIVLKRSRHTGWLWAWAGLPVLAIAAIAGLWLYRDALPQDVRFLQLFDVRAWYPRLVPYWIGWNSVLDSPWIGHGAGSSHALYQAFERSVPEASAVLPQADYKHIHNEYLEWLQDGGMLALAGYLGVWGWLSIKGIRLFLDEGRDRETRWMALAAFTGLLAFHLHSLFEVSARMPANRLGLFMMAGLVLALDSRPDAQARQGQTRAVWKLMPMAMAALLAWNLAIELPRQNDTLEAYFFQEQTERSPEKRRHIEQESDSAEAIYKRISYKLFALKDPIGVKPLMDRLDALVPGFQELEFMRLYHYMLENQKTGLDRGEVDRLMRAVRADKRYNAKTTHFMLQFAAHMNDPELFLEVMEDRLYMMSIAYRLRKIDDRKSTLVRVDPAGSGFLLVYSDKKTGFIMGMQQLKLLMEIAREEYSRKDAAARLSEIPPRVRMLHPVSPRTRVAIDAMAKDFFGPALTILAETPNL